MKVCFLFFTDPPRPFSSSVAALSAAVKAAGHQAMSVEVRRKSRIDDAVDRVAGIDADVLAVSSMTRDWPGAAALLSRLGERTRAYVVAGGYHPTLAPRDVASCERVDAVCIGEGERPLVAVLEQLRSARPRESLPGLWVRGPSGFSDPIPEGDSEPDIADLPPWDYDVFGDMREILDRGVNTFGARVDRYLPVRASRGCPFTCTYCSAPKWGKVGKFNEAGRRNVRPVNHLCDELAALRDRYDPEGFEFWDEHFPLALEWLQEFAEVYPSRVGLPFKAEMHPNAANRARLELLAKAGLSMFHCGVEAADEDLRRNVLNRRTRDSVLQRVFDDCRDLGIATSASVMTMLPGETREQMMSTVSLLRQLEPQWFVWSTYQALPGTVLGEKAVPKWPEPARERFDDYRRIESATPAQATLDDKDDVYRAFGEYQADLVRAAVQEHEATRTRERPDHVAGIRKRPSRELVTMLGLSPPDAPLHPRTVRVNTVAPEHDALIIEVESDFFPPQEVVISALDSTTRYFTSTARLGFAYRGRNAPPGLTNTLRAMAQRLAHCGIEDLRRAI
jgi:anaerobic magnesium-protoporphyrin IX monomethyl ester cyclase